MKRTESVASVTCLYLCDVCAFLAALEGELWMMQHTATVYEVRLRVRERERGKETEKTQGV